MTLLQVLIVEDREADAELMVKELRKAGFDPEWRRVESERAFQAHLTPSLDVVLCDYTLPQASAPRILELARASATGVPVIIVSGTIGDERAAECLKLGACDYILKDRMARLGGAVRNAIDERLAKAAVERAEAALHESEARMRQVLSTIDDVVWSVALPDAKVLYLNPAAERLLGRPTADFLSDPLLWMESIHPDDRVRALAAQEAALRWGTAEYEYRILRPDASVRQAQMRCWVAYGGDGAPARIEGILTDVTEKRGAEQELRRRQGMLEEAEALAHVGSWEWDVARDAAALSAEGCRIWGLPVDAPPHPVAWFQDRVHPEDRQALEAAVQGAVETGQAYDLVARVLRDDGVRHVRHRGRVAQRDAAGKVQRITGIIEDVTERKAAEAQRAALEASRREEDRLAQLNAFKAQFIAMVAHDLNNVLTPMRLNLEQAMREGRQEGRPPSKALAGIEGSLRRLAGFLADLLDAARLQSGHLDISVAPFDLAEALRQMVDAARPEAEASGVRLGLEAPPALRVQADRRRIEQVASNLLSNALKFTPHGGAVTLALETAGDRVRLAVRDTGPGIAPEDQPRLFRPFVRLQATPQGKHTGTGLGLYICRGIAEQHGGRIWCESAGLGKGTAFLVELPAAPPAT